MPPRFVQRPEHFVQYQQRKRLARTLGDHLRDREPQHQVRQILLATRDDRLRQPVLEHDDVVLIVEFELAIPALGQIREEPARQLGDFRTKRKVEVRPQIGERTIQLVVHPLVPVQRVQLGLQLVQLPASDFRPLHRRPRRGRFRTRRQRRDLPPLRLRSGPFVLLVHGLIRRLREIDPIPPRAHLLQPPEDARRRCLHPRPLTGQLRFALYQCPQPRRPCIQGRQSLGLALEERMPRGVVATRDRRDVALQRRPALLLARQVARDLLPLLHRELHFRQPPLERAGILRQPSAPLVERTHVGRHLFELLEPVPEVLAIHLHGVRLLRQQIEDRAIVAAQGTRTRRALPFFAGRDQPLALLPEVVVLGPQCLELRLGLLAVAHPLGAASLELPLGFLQFPPPGLQFDRHFLLECRRAAQFLTPLAQLLQLVGDRPLTLDQCLPPPFLAIPLVGVLQLGHDRGIRRQLPAERLQLLTRRGNIGQLTRDPLAVAG